MAKFLKKSIVVEANQFLNRAEAPLGVHFTEDYVITAQGRKVPVSVGEWVIQESDGTHYYPCSDKVFKANFSPLGAEGSLKAITDDILRRCYWEPSKENGPRPQFLGLDKEIEAAILVERERIINLISGIPGIREVINEIRQA